MLSSIISLSAIILIELNWLKILRVIYLNEVGYFWEAFMSNTEEFEKIDANFENAKKVIEFVERLMKTQSLDYDAHVERLQSLRFLYQRLVTLKELELAELARQAELAEQARQAALAELTATEAVVEAEEDDDDVPF
jgi:hypothetical protein